MLKMSLPYAVKFMPNIQAAITARHTISAMVTARRAPRLASRSVHMTSTAPGIPQRPHDKHRAQRRSSNARDRAYTVKQSMQIAHYFTIFFRPWRMISSNGRFSTSTPLRASCTSWVE